MTRLFAAALSAETNVFSPLPTSIASFRDSVFCRPGEVPQEAPLVATGALWVARRQAAAEGFTLVEGSCFSAIPAGPLNRADYEAMRDEILDQMRAALPLDGVLLGLHGAMAVHGIEDPEADILAGARALVGPRCVIGALLDPHCHLSAARLRLADVLVLYKEFPHTDVVARAEDLLRLVLDTILGRIRPVMSLFDCRQIGSYPTAQQPMRGLVDRAADCEGSGGILSVSLAHGFAHGDSPDLGARVLVVADGDKAAADRVAVSIGQEFVALRGRTEPAFLPADAALDAALAIGDGPVVIADPTDNAGGGAASDNTGLLRRLLARGIAGSAVAPLWDPVAVRLCHAAGTGARLRLRFGGKLGPASGLPVDAEVEVVGLARDAWQSFGPARQALGDCAAVRAQGVTVVLIANRTQALGLELFTNLGLEPRGFRILVLKSHHHFRAAYGPIARAVLFAASGGPLRTDPHQIPYCRVRRPIWPLDEATSPGLVA